MTLPWWKSNANTMFTTTFWVSPTLVAANALLQSAVHYLPVQKKTRHWLLPTFNALLMSVIAIPTLMRWLFVHNLAPTLLGDLAFQQLQAYLIVDLAYSGVLCRDSTQKFLELWVHHIAYIIFVCAVMTLGKSGFADPYLFVEIPAAIRAMGTLNPAWRSDVGFGITFFALRVVAPFFIVARDWPAYEGYYFAIVGAMQTLHIYWFVLWCRYMAKGDKRRD
jgi:hypothetical protein